MVFSSLFIFSQFSKLLHQILLNFPFQHFSKTVFSKVFYKIKFLLIKSNHLVLHMLAVVQCKCQVLPVITVVHIMPEQCPLIVVQMPIFNVMSIEACHWRRLVVAFLRANLLCVFATLEASF